MRFLSLLRRGLEVLLSQFRDLAFLVLLLSAGSYLIARHFLPSPSAYGVGMLVFGGISLYLRLRTPGD